MGSAKEYRNAAATNSSFRNFAQFGISNPTAPGRARIVNLSGADHYLFLSNSDDVISELKVFLAGLQ